MRNIHAVPPLHLGSGGQLGLNRYEPFWGKLLSGTNPYAWEEVRWSGSAWVTLIGGRSGTVTIRPAYEVTSINNLPAGTIVLLLEGFQGKDYRFAHLRYGTSGTENPCPSNEATLCTIVWDIKAYCTFVSGSGHKYDPAVDGFPSFLYSGATVTIKEVDFTVFPAVVTTYDTGTTDSHGSYCKTIPPKIADPSVTPTIDPVGGGVSGGALNQGTYTAEYTYTNQYGETKASPASASFQVGVPNPTQAPTTSTATVNATGGGSTGGSLQADTYYLRYTFTDASGETLSSNDSAAFTVAAGNIPRATLPGLGSRTYATGMSIYLASDNGFGAPGTYHKYATGVTGTTYDLTAAWVNTNPSPPGTNTTAKNIPRMSVAGSTGSEKGNIYLNNSIYHAFTGLPVDLIWAGSFGVPHPPPTRNATAPVRFQVVVSGVGDCPAQTYPAFWVSAPCSTVTVGVGFCCFKNCFNVSDYDVGGSLSPTLTCSGRNLASQPLTPGSGGCTNIADIAGGLAKPSDNTFYGATNCPNCVDNNSASADDPRPPGGVCGWTYCSASGGDYWDRCFHAPSPCAVPSITTTKSVKQFPKLNWLRNICCGLCTSTPPGTDRVPEIIPRKIYGTLSGPDEILGSYNGTPIELDWSSSSDDGTDPTIYAGCQAGTTSGPTCSIVWDSGCLPPSGAKWYFWKIGSCNGSTAAYQFQENTFASCRLIVVQAYTGGGGAGRSCKTYISFINYYGSSCSDFPLPTPPAGAFLIPDSAAGFCPLTCVGGGSPVGNYFSQTFNKGIAAFNFGILGADGISAVLCGPVNYYMGGRDTVSGDCGAYGPRPDWTGHVTE
jgi:hypothetical protein